MLQGRNSGDPVTASWVGKAQWCTWETNAVVWNCQKNVMLVPFYVVFCHHRKVSEYTVDSDESQFLLHHMDGWVLCILYLVNSWQQNALWKECKPTESPCLHISVSKGGSIKKKEAGGHNLIPDRYTSHQLMLSKCYHIGVLLGTSLL